MKQVDMLIDFIVKELKEIEKDYDPYRLKSFIIVLEQGLKFSQEVEKQIEIERKKKHNEANIKQKQTS